MHEHYLLVGDGLYGLLSGAGTTFMLIGALLLADPRLLLVPPGATASQIDNNLATLSSWFFVSAVISYVLAGMTMKFAAEAVIGFLVGASISLFLLTAITFAIRCLVWFTLRI